MVEYAKSKGVTLNLEDVFEGFCDYHLKHGNKHKDWSATWRTWIRNHIRFFGKDATGPKISTKEDVDRMVNG